MDQWKGRLAIESNCGIVSHNSMTNGSSRAQVCAKESMSFGNFSLIHVLDNGSNNARKLIVGVRLPLK